MGYIHLTEFRYPQMPLSDITVRNARPTEKTQKLFDAAGLCLMVHPNGSKYWRLKYRFLGKEKVTFH